MAHAGRVRVPWAEPGDEAALEWMEVAPVGPPGAAVGTPQVVARGPGRVVAGGGPGYWENGVWVSGPGRVPAWSSVAQPMGSSVGTPSSASSLAGPPR
jgi:hypothetical protein